jgi:hypothetical protein
MAETKLEESVVEVREAEVVEEQAEALEHEIECPMPRFDDPVLRL